MKKRDANKEELLDELVQLIIAISGDVQNINAEYYYMYNEAMVQDIKRNVVNVLDVINKLKKVNEEINKD